MQEYRIRTARMELIASSAVLLKAELRSSGYLSVLLNAVVMDGWPPETWKLAAEEFMARIEKHPGLAGWLNWYWVLVEGDRRTLIGSGGFTGAPFNGEAMVGYAVLKPYQGRGYGSEAVSALANWAFARPGVQRIVAETNHTNKKSIRLLEKCGFEYAGKGFERDTIRYVMPKEKWLLSIK
jgi:RimJ/RimL family protein N-acetyltransferase